LALAVAGVAPAAGATAAAMGSLARFSCLANPLRVPANQQGKFRNEQFQAWKDVDHSILFMSESQVGFFLLQ
jgi:ADP-dependent phosphofructokinase/glucokinase